MSSTLCAHVDSSLVTLDTLRALPPPAVRGRFHRPIPHADLVEATRATFTDAGFAIAKEQLALNPAGTRVFGVLDLVSPAGASAECYSYGFRSSTDSTLAIRGVAGLRVFVCDNLALSGDEFVLKRKSTTHVALEALLRVGLERWLAARHLLDQEIAAARSMRLTEEEARALAYTLFATGTLPLRLLPWVHRGLFEAERTEDGEALAIGVDPYERLTPWGVHSAATWALHQLPIAQRFPATVALGRAILSRRA
jgi:hypothetical protein